MFPLGMAQHALQRPADLAVPSRSIVFVHGLQGHPYLTWAATKALGTSESRLVPAGKGKHGDNPSRRRRPWWEFAWRRSWKEKQGPFKTSQPPTKQVFWPSDLLPAMCPRARILMYGYDTKIAKYTMTTGTNQNTIYAHAKDLLFALSRESERVGLDLCRPLIFVAHSLGGLW